jgi:hypothetical protein
MPTPTTKITDVWFRSPLSLAEMAVHLALREVHENIENRWQWVIGRLNLTKLDITRDHTEPAVETDTRIFILSGGRKIRSFDERLLNELVRRLRRFVEGPIYCGRWVYLRGDDFDPVVVEVR